jgi:cytochrome c peroxidase
MNKLSSFRLLVITGLSLNFCSAVEDAELEPFLPFFKSLPKDMATEDCPVSAERVKLGKMLYFETRISKGGLMSCNSCHVLSQYGQDNLPFSPGHEGKLGGRSSPSTLNAALHIAQFWDGRAPSVEEQAKGPVLNPVEMGAPSKEFVVEVLKSMPAYVAAFKAAFPEEKDPVTYDLFGKAVGAFERTLVTPTQWDKYLEGDKTALSPAEKQGFLTFAKAGCVTCHNGPGVGGQMYQKLGLTKEWPGLKDEGKAEQSKLESEKFIFKVPSLRNVTETAPYLHDGSVKTLAEMVKMMAEFQLGKMLTDTDVAEIVTYLNALKGQLPTEVMAPPVLPESSPTTPKA